MSKPTILPEWGTGVGAVVTEPSQGKKEAGWVFDEEPSEGQMNWWQNNVFQWVGWLDGVLNDNSLFLSDGPTQVLLIDTSDAGEAQISTPSTSYDITLRAGLAGAEGLRITSGGPKVPSSRALFIGDADAFRFQVNGAASEIVFDDTDILQYDTNNDRLAFQVGGNDIFSVDADKIRLNDDVDLELRDDGDFAFRAGASFREFLFSASDGTRLTYSTSSNQFSIYTQAAARFRIDGSTSEFFNDLIADSITSNNGVTADEIEATQATSLYLGGAKTGTRYINNTVTACASVVGGVSPSYTGNRFNFSSTPTRVAVGVYTLTYGVAYNNLASDLPTVLVSPHDENHTAVAFNRLNNLIDIYVNDSAGNRVDADFSVVCIGGVHP